MDLNLQLEMPLEALVLRQPAGAGPLWACLAVLAAAFGLWRIRSTAVYFKPEDRRSPPNDRCHKPQPPPRQPQPESGAGFGLPRDPEGRSPPRAEGCNGDPPSISFVQKETVFEVRRRCEVDDRGGVDAAGEEEEEPAGEPQQKELRGGGGGAVARGFICWGENWRGDLGWYVHQDVTALNGRVVRLWEDERRSAASRSVRRRPAEAPDRVGPSRMSII